MSEVLCFIWIQNGVIRILQFSLFATKGIPTGLEVQGYVVLTMIHNYIVNLVIYEWSYFRQEGLDIDYLIELIKLRVVLD